MTGQGSALEVDGSTAPIRLRYLWTFDQLFSCWLASLIFGDLLWRSLATLATSSYLCCALTPAIRSVNFAGRDRPQLADSRGPACSPNAAFGNAKLLTRTAAYGSRSACRFKVDLGRWPLIAAVDAAWGRNRCLPPRRSGHAAGCGPPSIFERTTEERAAWRARAAVTITDEDG
jgi:hypothetical protein